MLTTGSTISVAMELIPYSMATSGVSLRLRGVQVIDYIPYKPASPFDVESGFSSADAPAAESVEDMFGGLADAEDEVEVVAEPEPVKRQKKKDDPKPDGEDLSSIIDDWGGK